jgi:hypothetical protein
MGLPERLRIIDLTPAMTKMDNRRLVPICDRLFDLLQPLRRDSGPVISLKKPEGETARLRRVTGIPITPGMTTEDSGKNQKTAELQRHITRECSSPVGKPPQNATVP